jgi:predicted peptidase
MIQAGIQNEFSFERTYTKKAEGRYLLFIPKAYIENENKWPLILFLHGLGERGSDIERIKVHGIPKIVAAKPDFPFITGRRQLYFPSPLPHCEMLPLKIGPFETKYVFAA